MVDDSYEIIYEETPINETPCELCTAINNPYLNRNRGDSRYYNNPFNLGISGVDRIKFAFFNPSYSSEHDGHHQKERGFWNFKVRNEESSSSDAVTSTVTTTDSSTNNEGLTVSETVVDSSVSNNVGTSASNADNDNIGSDNNIGSNNNNGGRPSGSNANSKPIAGSSSTASNTNNAHIQIPTKACCGEWPSKYPYSTGRNRKCCGASTYNASKLRCCKAPSAPYYVAIKTHSNL